jgi:uncharacterized membrane protein YjjP (DUF1212 family)
MSDAASRMGALMLGSGTGSYRVLQAMHQVAAALGIDQLQAQVTLTHIVSTTTRQGIFRTQVVEVPAPGVNADRIAALETISRNLPAGSSAAELGALLDEVEHRAALYGTGRLVVAAAAACAAFAFLNNGGWAECLVVFGAVACGRSRSTSWRARGSISSPACLSLRPSAARPTSRSRPGYAILIQARAGCTRRPLPLPSCFSCPASRS